MTVFYVHIFASVLLFHFVVVNCLETVTVETDGNLYVPSNSQFQRLWCNFTVSLRVALRVRWYNGRDIVAHYEENITDVGKDYKSYVDTIGDFTKDNAAISLNVTNLILKTNATQVTYKCEVHIYNGTSSQISFKNTTVQFTVSDELPSGLNVGAIVGIVIGALVGVAGVIALFVCFFVYHGQPKCSGGKTFLPLSPNAVPKDHQLPQKDEQKRFCPES